MFAAANPALDLERATIRQVTWRIIPFLMVCYFIAFVDRVNAGFAALHMNQDIGLSAAAFGLGGGLFYVSYVLFEATSQCRKWVLVCGSPGSWSAGASSRQRWRSSSAPIPSMLCACF